MNKTDVAVHLRTTDELARIAFLGQAAFLAECAAATDFSDDRPIVPKQRRASRYVYFIGAEGGPIKIGTARVPYQRLFTLQTAHYQQLFIYAVTPGGKREEEKLHREFSEFRIRGEWFEPSHPLLCHIIGLQEAARRLVD
jgi:hypothetical protein